MRTAPLALALLAAAAAPSARAEGREGALGAGVHLAGPMLGAAEFAAAGGTAAGVSLGLAPRWDAGRSLAIRMPLHLDIAGHFGVLELAPGVTWRWRGEDGRGWVPYLGVGVPLGVVVAGRDLLGWPAVPTAIPGLFADLDWDDHHTSGPPHDPYADGDGGRGADDDPGGFTKWGAELWAGFEWRPAKWFALSFDFSWTVAGVGPDTVQVFRQGLSVDFAL